MAFWISISLAVAVSALVGYMLGSLKRDHELTELWRMAERRGSYWFDKYQRAISDDWEPLSEDWTPHDNY